MVECIARRAAALTLCFVCGTFVIGCASGSLLEEAYQTRRAEPLQRLFQRWHDTSRAFLPRYLASEPEVVRATYEIFETFYRPGDFSVLGLPAVHVSPNTTTRAIAVASEASQGVLTPRYMFIQRRVRYDIVDSIGLPDSDSSQNTQRSPRVLAGGMIEDFRPDVSVPPGFVRVYLTESRETELTEFLMRDPVATNDADPYPRHRFLAQYITATPGDWVRSWNFATPPRLSWVRFDRTLERALVTFDLGGRDGAELLIQKRGTVWIVLQSQQFSTIG